MEFLGSLIPWVQLALSLLLIATILLQQSGASVGGSFGGADMGHNFTRRGFEKTLFRGTIVLVILFATSALIALFL